MPVCSYFLLGECTKDDCPYRHVNVNEDAEICKNFLQGYCPCADKVSLQLNSGNTLLLGRSPN